MLAVFLAVIFVATAHAAEYKSLLCAGDNGSNSFGTSTNSPNFTIENYCGPAPDPAGGAAFVRITENQPNGYASEGAYAFMHWDTPSFVHYRTAGGYTREPESFNDGWRARFWIAGGSAGERGVFTQGAGLPNAGEDWGSWPTFIPHLWHVGGYLDFTRFAFEMRCVRPGGCDRQGFNATDANTFNFILSDESPSQVSWTSTGDPFMDGGWVRGGHALAYTWTERGSGMRFERVYIDNALFKVTEQGCDVGWTPTSGEFARAFQPCPTYEGLTRNYPIDTTTLPDGGHWLVVCTQDYAQYQGLSGTGGQTCDGRTVRTDNTAPGAPPGLVVTSANPSRYLDHFGAQFSLPPNQGSPITKVHYEVINALGAVVTPERIVSAVNPTALAGVEGPAKAGEYSLRVRLEDEVGFVGPPATAPIPRDTTPPAAPQDLSVTAPSVPRAAQGLDVHWRNLTDAGSPISAVRYQVLNGRGDVVVPTRTLNAANPQTIPSLDTPRERGAYGLRLWLEDAEGNIGAPASAPLSYDCVKSDTTGGSRLSAGLGAHQDQSLLVNQSQGATLSGKLEGTGQLADAPLCVFSEVVTSQDREFLGIAMTGGGGDYRFAVAEGPSRDLDVVYRPDQREVIATAALRTKVRPTFSLGHKVVHNKGVAIFRGSIPGPQNENVVVVLQVKDGKRWRVIRRYRTRPGGDYLMRYRFTQTRTPTTYKMRVEVPQQSGYSYEGGVSQTLPLHVRP